MAEQNVSGQQKKTISGKAGRGTTSKARTDYGPLVPNPMRKRPGMERARDVLGYTYPIDRRDADDRFSTALLHEIAEALENRGYPELRPGRDMFRLMQALAWFLYRRGA